MVHNGIFGVPRDIDHLHIRAAWSEPPCEFAASKLTHNYLPQKDVDRPRILFGDFQGVAPVSSLEDLISATFQVFLPNLTQRILVFDEQNGFCPNMPLLSIAIYRGDRGVLRHQRQVDLEHRPMTDFAINPNPAAALFDDPIHSCEAESRAFPRLLRGIKRLENPGTHLIRHPNSVICNGEHYVVTGFGGGMVVRIVLIQSNISGFDRHMTT